jgi:hypothetical protein
VLLPSPSQLAAHHLQQQQQQQQQLTWMGAFEWSSLLLPARIITSDSTTFHINGRASLINAAELLLHNVSNL